MNFNKVFPNITDYHLAIFVVIFGAGCLLQWFGHLDMAFVAFTGTVIGGITGHAFSPSSQQAQQIAKDKAQIQALTDKLTATASKDFSAERP